MLIKQKTKRFFAFLLTTLILIGGTTANAADVSESSNWATDEIAEAIDLGLIPTDLQSDYEQPISRLDFCRLMTTALEKFYGSGISEILQQHKLTAETSTFSDTQDASVLAANALGIVNGTGDGEFLPGGKISRAEAVTMLIRTARVTGKFNALPYLYDDTADIPSWARDAVYAANAYGIMTGNNKNCFLPQAAYTREAAYVTVLRLYQALQKGSKEDASSSLLYPMSNSAHLWGYVDSSGSFVIQPQYAYASGWNGSYGIVSLPGTPNTYFVIDRTGTQVAGNNESAGQFSVDSSKAEKPYFLGNTLCAPEVSGSSLFRLPEGTQLTSDQQDFSSLSDGVITAWDGINHLTTYYDRNGELLTSTAYSFGGSFYQGIAIAGNYGESTPSYFLLHRDSGSAAAFVGPDSIFDGAVGNLLIVHKDWTDETYQYHEAFGVQRADGTNVLPVTYENLKLTPAKQIIAQTTAGEAYKLFDETGKELYQFPVNFDGTFLFDGVETYLYASGSSELTLLSTAGIKEAVIPIDTGATFSFISGLVQVIDTNGSCQYYSIDGTLVAL